MNDLMQNKIINSFLLILGGLGLIWMNLQKDSFFIYFHPVSILSLIFFSIGIIRSLIQIKRFGFKAMIYEVIVSGLFLLVILGFKTKESEILKANKIFEAKLIDDLSGINLILREDGTFETESYTIYGGDVITGKYELIGDTIVFKDKPYDNDFMPNRVLIDKERQRVWVKRLEDGRFDTTEYFAGFFEVRFNELE